MLEGEPLIEEYKTIEQSLLFPKFLYPIAKPILSALGLKRIRFIIESSKELSGYDQLCLF
jgi:hypothetical protein